MGTTACEAGWQRQWSIAMGQHALMVQWAKHPTLAHQTVHFLPHSHKLTNDCDQQKVRTKSKALCRLHGLLQFKALFAQGGRLWVGGGFGWLGLVGDGIYYTVTNQLFWNTPLVRKQIVGSYGNCGFRRGITRRGIIFGMTNGPEIRSSSGRHCGPGNSRRISDGWHGVRRKWSGAPGGSRHSQVCPVHS